MNNALHTITLEPNSTTPKYIQLTNALINLIVKGHLQAGDALPGTRSLAQLLQVHRQTIIKSYSELEAQGWIVTQPASGSYISNELPIPTQATYYKDSSKSDKALHNAIFPFQHPNFEIVDKTPRSAGITIDDGTPDVSIVPIRDMLATYRALTQKPYHRAHMKYASFYGHPELRHTLVDYLRQTRGLVIDIDNILITRGTIMGIYLASELILKNGIVVVGNTNYINANHTFIQSGATLKTVPVDHQGMQIEAIQAICEETAIQAVYVTSHHHHPTTVSLSPARRMALAQLAQQYQFAIIEDDYAFDYNYDMAPLMPIASYAQSNTIYVGSFCKLLAPSIRVGFMVGPKDFIRVAAQLRRLIDRQGDPIMEQVISKMIRNGELRNHAQKSLKLYRSRRDTLCHMLNQLPKGYITFQKPTGGMAVWVQLAPKFSWTEIAKYAQAHQVYLPQWQEYDYFSVGHNGIRIGFATLDYTKAKKLVDVLAKAVIHTSKK